MNNSITTKDFLATHSDIAADVLNKQPADEYLYDLAE